MALFTVYGGRGFVGGHIARALAGAGHEVALPERDSVSDTEAMGHVIYCAGVTGDFRRRPYDTMEAHVALPARILRTGRYESFLYLSSTRIYGDRSDGREEAEVSVRPAAPGDLYNLSKLAGEALCLSHETDSVRVARLSNVYGAEMFAADPDAGNFLTSIVRDAVHRRSVRLGAAAESAKDYVHIDDAARALILIARRGTHRIYNVASGRNLTHGELLDRLMEIVGGSWDAAPGAPIVRFPRIPTDRIAALFTAAGERWAPDRLSDRLPDLAHAARRADQFTQGAVA